MLVRDMRSQHVKLTVYVAVLVPVSLKYFTLLNNMKDKSCDMNFWASLIFFFSLPVTLVSQGNANCVTERSPLSASDIVVAFAHHANA